MVDVYDHDIEKRILADQGTASVGATGATELCTISIDDGAIFHLERAEADFTGTTVLTVDRGLIIREELSGGNTNLVRSQTDGSTTPYSSSLVYHNDNGETATLALRGFHGDTTASDMFGHMTWHEVSQSG